MLVPCGWRASTGRRRGSAPWRSRGRRTAVVPALAVTHVSALSFFAALPSMLLHPAILAEVLHLLPLFGCKFAAQGKQIARVRLLQLRPRLGYLIDLRQDPGLIRLVVADQRLHFELSFFDVGPQIN